MKPWIFSNLHLEHAPLREPLEFLDGDFWVVAGALCRGPAHGVRWLAQHIAPLMPCVYVAGNYASRKGLIREGLEDGRDAAEFPGVDFMENGTVTIGGIHFVGATLWTEYRIEEHQLAMRDARERTNDYPQIALQRKPWQRFIPKAAARMHQDSRRFIENTWRAAAFPPSSSPTICRTRRHWRSALRATCLTLPTLPTIQRSPSPAARRSGCTVIPLRAAIICSMRPASSAIHGHKTRSTSPSTAGR